MMLLSSSLQTFIKTANNIKPDRLNSDILTYLGESKRIAASAEPVVFQTIPKKPLLLPCQAPIYS